MDVCPGHLAGAKGTRVEFALLQAEMSADAGGLAFVAGRPFSALSAVVLVRGGGGAYHLPTKGKESKCHVCISSRPWMVAG